MKTQHGFGGDGMFRWFGWWGTKGSKPRRRLQSIQIAVGFVRFGHHFLVVLLLFPFQLLLVLVVVVLLLTQPQQFLLGRIDFRLLNVLRVLRALGL